MQTPRERKLSKKERRVRRQRGGSGEGGDTVNDRFNFTLKHINPLTDNQRVTFDSYEQEKHLLLIGTAGTGKSFLSVYLGMVDIMENKSFDKMIIIRSVVPTREMGYLPGTSKEKSKVYEAPYYSIFSELFERGDAYEYMKTKGVVEFMTTSFVRGITLNDAVIVVDECQSMTWHEISSVFTRVGKNCRIIFSGDVRQNDLMAKRGVEASGVENLIKVLHHMPEFNVVEFTSADIVRSDLVKSFIITCEKLGF